MGGSGSEGGAVQAPRPAVRRAALAVGLLLLVLHQDWWLWEDGSLVLGVVPVGLAWHAAFSVAAAALWGLVLRGAFRWEEADA